MLQGPEEKLGLFGRQLGFLNIIIISPLLDGLSLLFKKQIIVKTKADSPFRQKSKMFSLYSASLKYVETL
ncbi:hypothetical protein GCM10023260_12050 [Bartonella acomydis]|uniref:Uncharacterized protein n=1 Tax=Bartonella acomydis TaxID=686234 RepID=A0ABP9MXF0_9HYPH